jgi:hypothetical protein
MPNRSEAEEHLRIIRSLMEKATIYRAISAPTALVGGLLALIAAGILWRLTPAQDGEPENWPDMRLYFLMPWLLVLALTGAANMCFLWRDARLRGDPFISPGMKAALTALAPSFLVAGYCTFFLVGCFSSGAVLGLPTIWMVLYGVGLLATSHFSPRSIHVLGWSFLVAGLASLTGAWILPWLREPWQICNLQMAATFGLFHIIYAACTWRRKPIHRDSGGEG